MARARGARPLGGRPQDLFTLRPVARAQFVGLQRIEEAQRLLRIAANVQTIDRDMLDHIVGVDDEGGAIGDTSIGSDDAERVGEILLVVGDPREISAASRSSDLRHA